MKTIEQLTSEGYRYCPIGYVYAYIGGKRIDAVIPGALENGREVHEWLCGWI